MFDKTTKSHVMQALKNFPNTRNHDKSLILKVWEQEGLILAPEIKEKFLQGKISTPDSITRAKRDIQHDGLFRPDAYDIRKAKESDIRTNYREEKGNNREVLAEIDRPLTQGSCPTCGAGFISKQHLINHIKEVHR